MTDGVGRTGPVVVRDAGEVDLPHVVDIYADHVLNGTSSFEEIAPDLAEITRRWRAVTEAGLPYLVAEFEGAVRGFGYLAPFRARRAYRYTLEDSVYVGRSSVRMGIGSALLQALLERCRAQNYRRVVAVIADSANNAASIAIHKKFGFSLDGRLPDVGYKFERWLDIVLMSRSLVD